MASMPFSADSTRVRNPPYAHLPPRFDPRRDSRSAIAEWLRSAPRVMLSAALLVGQLAAQAV